MTRSFSILFCSFILVVTGCQPKAKTKAQQAPAAVRLSAAGMKSSCPYLTKDATGNPVLCWVQATDTTGHHLLYFATSHNGGSTFEAPKAIPTSKGVYPHDENLSKIIYKPNGDMLALFAVSNPSDENSYAGLVYYTQSFDGGDSWTAPKQLSENTIRSIDERYFDVTLLPNGEVAAVWLDSRKENADKAQKHMQMNEGTSMKGMQMDSEGSSLYYASTNGRNGFAREKVIARHTCQCCRTALYVDGQRRLHVAYRGILQDSIRDMMHQVSDDNGSTFSAPERISPDNWVIDGCPHTGPAMAANQNGMHYAWFTMGGGSGVYYCTQPEGKSFTARQSVSSVPSAKHPQLMNLENGNLALVWDEGTQQGNRVGLQWLDASGNFTGRDYLTPDTSNASFPVIATAGKVLLVAYTKRQNGQSEVWYQQVPQQ
ncbi:sialidase family protein [Pontibacter chitinilyticus]|uniref:sialidase family protein n=1 Tax=Pontibacter chitinilyticus TaxID=2674989 RepID=UPI00321956A9